MASSEIESLLNKLKALCQSGRNATLTLSSNAGKAVVKLRVDLGVPLKQDPHHQHQPKHSRNGPAKH